MRRDENGAPLRECQRCGADFAVYGSRAKWCNGCKTYECEHCGKSVSHPPSQASKGRFCSVSCAKRHEAKDWKARFWSKVSVAGPEECWDWIGAKTSNGYARMIIEGKSVMGSRVSYMIAHDLDEFPEGLHALHHCDRPICVNPSHIFTGTDRDNLYDSMEKGRARSGGRKGEDQHLHKLTEDDVREIRRATSAGIQQKVLAERYGVHRDTIRNVMIGRTWAWLD